MQCVVEDQQSAHDSRDCLKYKISGPTQTSWDRICVLKRKHWASLQSLLRDVKLLFKVTQPIRNQAWYFPPRCLIKCLKFCYTANRSRTLEFEDPQASKSEWILSKMTFSIDQMEIFRLVTLTTSSIDASNVSQSSSLHSFPLSTLTALNLCHITVRSFKIYLLNALLVS